jgi:hypothetical protein
MIEGSPRPRPLGRSRAFFARCGFSWPTLFHGYSLPGVEGQVLWNPTSRVSREGTLGTKPSMGQKRVYFV